jgi:hypothetical protein
MSLIVLVWSPEICLYMRMYIEMHVVVKHFLNLSPAS